MPTGNASDATNSVAEQARAFLAWAEREMSDGVFNPGAVRELKERVARILYELSQQSGDCGGRAARLWQFFSAVDPREHPDGHRRFIESFRAGEPTERSLADLWHADFICSGRPKTVDAVPWKEAQERGFAGRPAAAELLQAIRVLAEMDSSLDSPTAGLGAGVVENDPEAEQPGVGTAESRATREAVHSADFTSVNWFGTEYSFAYRVQSKAVKALWDEWEKTGLGLHQDTIGNAIDAERDNFRVDTAFRNHPALGTMIKACGDGKYRLAPPADSKAPPAS